MRILVFFPLTTLVAFAAGCGSEVREQAASSVPQRDLTLVTQSPQVEIASPLETQQLRIQRRTVHYSQLAARLVPVASSPVIAEPTPQPITEPAPAAAAPLDEHELLPGNTVTIIPVNSGPSIGTDKGDELPADRGRAVRTHAGGGCRGGRRGPDIGMAPAPRPDFR